MMRRDHFDARRDHFGGPRSDPKCSDSITRHRHLPELPPQIPTLCRLRHTNFEVVRGCRAPDHIRPSSKSHFTYSTTTIAAEYDLGEGRRRCDLGPLRIRSGTPEVVASSTEVVASSTEVVASSTEVVASSIEVVASRCSTLDSRDRCTEVVASRSSLPSSPTGGSLFPMENPGGRDASKWSRRSSSLDVSRSIVSTRGVEIEFRDVRGRRSLRPAAQIVLHSYRWYGIYEIPS